MRGAGHCSIGANLRRRGASKGLDKDGSTRQKMPAFAGMTGFNFMIGAIYQSRRRPREGADLSDTENRMFSWRFCGMSRVADAGPSQTREDGSCVSDS